MYTIQNDTLLVQLSDKGAELTRIYHKQHQLEYLWDAQPAFWGKHAPVLFPIVGTLKDNTYHYQGNTYQLPRHGFARDRNFTVAEQSEQHISLQLTDDAATRQVFPFAFVFTITYAVSGNQLTTTYQVSNPDSAAPLYFSVGGHPAFRLPLEEGKAYHDYTLTFDTEENSDRWPITQEGLIAAAPTPLLDNTRLLPLSKELFAKDALVLKHLRSTAVTLSAEGAPHGLRFDFTGFPFLGLWAAKGADFLCIEPWCGIADSELHNQELTEKEGIEQLQPGALFERSWSVNCF